MIANDRSRLGLDPLQSARRGNSQGTIAVRQHVGVRREITAWPEYRGEVNQLASRGYTGARLWGRSKSLACCAIAYICALSAVIMAGPIAGAGILTRLNHTPGTAQPGSLMTITLRVLDGADRGRVFDDLAPPVTIGREEGNSVQLNDERVSRYHIKIQDDHDRLVLTDLESTNGTKVNGEDIQLRILRFGDMITVGRSVLVFGSREQINHRLAKIQGTEHQNATLDPREISNSASDFDFDVNWSQNANMQATLHEFDPPELPERLSPGQAAQLSELLEYVHIRIRNILNAADNEGNPDHVLIEQPEWQNLIDLQSRLAEYLRRVGGGDSA